MTNPAMPITGTPVNTINKPVDPAKPVAAVIPKPAVIANAEEKEPLVSSTEPLKPVVVSTLTYVERVPSNWHILPTDDEEVIFATNSVTNKEFKGTRKAFSAFLKG